MYGIICNDELTYRQFQNYRLALNNYFGKENLKDVKNVVDLDDITGLIIVDEHYFTNASIWNSIPFIGTLNEKNIKVIIFNMEKINVPEFPWNQEYQRRVELINNCFQFLADTEEAVTYGKQINKFFLSKSNPLHVDENIVRKDAILFAGRNTGSEYSKRRETLDTINKLDIGIPVDIINTEKKLSYDEYAKLTNQYKYVVCPLGTGKFITLRHYEAIRLGCIPIQEVTEKMIPWYDDIKSNCIFFTDPQEIKDKIYMFTKERQEIYLEDFFEKLNLRSFIEN